MTRPPLDLSCLPPSKCIEELIKIFKVKLKEKKVNTKFFDNPEYHSTGDNEVIDDLNIKLKADPNHELPEGY